MTAIDVRLRTLRFAILVGAVALLAGCESFGKGEKPPLPGERISVLVHQRTLTPDPRAQQETITLPAPVANTAWPQAGGSATHAMHHLQLAERPRPLWSAGIGAGLASDRPQLASPVVANGRIFVMDAKHALSALDANTGRRVWKVNLARNGEDDDVTVGGIAYDEGRVFATTGFAQVIALDAETGEEIWRHKVNAPIHSAPTIRGGRLFAVTTDNTLHALSSDSGGEMWTHQAISESASLVGGASPAVDAGVVVTPFSSGELLALKLENGREVWGDLLASARRTDELSALSQVRGRPAIDRGRVFAVSFGGVLAAIDLRSGRRLWDKDIGSIENPWVAGRYVYQLTDEAELICLGGDDGRVFWVTPLKAFKNEKAREDPILWTGPILAGERLIVAGTNGQVVSVSPYDGTVLDTQTLTHGAAVSPVVADGTLYILSRNGELRAFR